MKSIEGAAKALLHGLGFGSRTLALCAGLALAACGGGGGSDGGPQPVPVAQAPSIGNQPRDAVVSDGMSATFNVGADGTSLTYQWQRDGKAIAGATGASYTTPALSMADNGARYQVVVAGPNASLTSNAVTLTVTPVALSLTTQPVAQTARDGEVVSFDVTATGSGPIQYQWHRDGIAIAGADKATYTTSALTLTDDAAVFKVVVTNPAGTVTSQEARLAVTAVAPRIVSAPDSVTSVDGAVVSFKATAAGSAPLAYQWLRNGSPISGATEASYTTTLAYANSGDRFSVQVGNSAGQVVSAAAVATVNAAAPAIARHPSDATIATGGSASFSVVAGGTAPLSFQWQQSQDGGLSWAAIPGATSASHAVVNATLADASTQLRVVVSNRAATLNSNVASLTVRANVRVLAGALGGSGYADGKGSAARFNHVWGMGADASGNIFVTDSTNSVIRRVGPDGTVTRFAGQAEEAVMRNGPLADARFVNPTDLLIDRAGTIYVLEGCVLRRISRDAVDSVVGDGSCITRDGSGAQVGISRIAGMAADADGTVFFTERTHTYGLVVRKLTPAGVLSTLAGSMTETGTADGVGGSARFADLGKLTIGADQNLYVADGTTIRLVTPAGVVSTYAGGADGSGQAEGYRTLVRFNQITGVAFDGGGNLLVADSARIARISKTGNVLTAVAAARDNGYATSVDGDVASASAGSPRQLISLPDGGIAFFDGAAFTVRVMTANGVLTTLAGGGRVVGFVDGVGPAARFGAHEGYLLTLAFAPTGVLNLADRFNQRIRRLTLATNRLDTIAGTAATGGDDGPASAASFSTPSGLAYDAAGNLYVADAVGLIRRISSAGMVSTVAGKLHEYGSVDGIGAAARFNQPSSVVVDSKGNLIVGDAQNYTLRKVTPDGVVTTLAGKAGEFGYANGVGSEARLGPVKCLAIDAADNVYFTENNSAIRKLAPNGEVSPVAGAPFSSGRIDDIGAFARFSNPGCMAVDARGNLYIADTGNHAIRRITPRGQVSTVIGGAGEGGVLRPGPGGSINQPTAIAVTPAGRLFFLSEGAIVGD